MSDKKQNKKRGQAADEGRREVLITLGKLALYTPPTLFALTVSQPTAASPGPPPPPPAFLPGEDW